MVRIGKIVATHGLQGTLVLTHIVGNSNWLSKGAALFIELSKDSRIPYFVAEAKKKNDEEYHVILEDVGEVATAKKLVGKHVYAEEHLLGKATAETPLLWIGFNIVDAELGSIGPLKDVTQAGPQWIGTVEYQGREVLIPLVSQMISDINARNRYIRMQLPQGLLDI